MHSHDQLQLQQLMMEATTCSPAVPARLFLLSAGSDGGRHGPDDNISSVLQPDEGQRPVWGFIERTVGHIRLSAPRKCCCIGHMHVVAISTLRCKLYHKPLVAAPPTHCTSISVPAVAPCTSRTSMHDGRHCYPLHAGSAPLQPRPHCTAASAAW